MRITDESIRTKLFEQITANSERIAALAAKAGAPVALSTERTISNHCYFERHPDCWFPSLCDCACHEALVDLANRVYDLHEKSFDLLR